MLRSAQAEESETGNPGLTARASSVPSASSWEEEEEEESDREPEGKKQGKH